MVFQSNTYSVLLVSASEKINTAILSLLPSTDFWPVTVVSNINKARRFVLEQSYDLVIVNSPLPDGSGTRFCAELCAQGEAGVLLLVKRELYEETYYDVLPSGVVTLPKPTSLDMLSQSLRVLCAIRERLRSARKKEASLEEKMEELRLLNRAKWLLITTQGMTEDEAHRAITRQAMEKRITKREAAEQIIRSFSENAP